MDTKVKKINKSQEKLVDKVQKTIFSIYEKSEEDMNFMKKDISIYKKNEKNFLKKI